MPEKSTSHFRLCIQRRKNRRFKQASPEGVIEGATATKLYQCQIKLTFVTQKQLMQLSIHRPPTIASRYSGGICNATANPRWLFWLSLVVIP